MSRQLPTDCLNEIFEHLEEDKIALHSCLLVNRLWCKSSVAILWRDIWDFRHYVQDHQLIICTAILSTLIACLPHESKELLYKDELFISTFILKPPLFNYVSFCKVLSIDELFRIIHDVLNDDESTTTSLISYLVAEEILKMFLNQISSLKRLTYYTYNSSANILSDISFTYFSGARYCLTDLLELGCSSNAPSKFLYQLYQVCHNLQSLTILFVYYVEDGLKELISSQNNLKNLSLRARKGYHWADIIPALNKHSNTLTKLYLFCDRTGSLPLLFVSLLSNLQEIDFSFRGVGGNFEDFKELQYVTFPKLQILKFSFKCPKPEHIKKFLEINGKNLKEFYMYNKNDAITSIAKFCPNLKKLCAIFNNDELPILNTIFNCCQDLEGIVIQCGKEYLSIKEVFKVVARYSPKIFYELKIIGSQEEFFQKDLEPFFISWKNRALKKPLNLILLKDYYKDYFKVNEVNLKIIEKYKNLGVIRKFEIEKINMFLYL